MTVVNILSQPAIAGTNDFQGALKDLFGSNPVSVWTGSLNFDSGGTLTFFLHASESGFNNTLMMDYALGESSAVRSTVDVIRVVRHSYSIDFSTATEANALGF